MLLIDGMPSTGAISSVGERLCSLSGMTVVQCVDVVTTYKVIWEKWVRQGGGGGGQRSKRSCLQIYFHVLSGSFRSTLTSCGHFVATL